MPQGVTNGPKFNISHIIHSVFMRDDLNKL